MTETLNSGRADGAPRADRNGTRSKIPSSPSFGCSRNGFGCSGLFVGASSTSNLIFDPIEAIRDGCDLVGELVLADDAVELAA